MNVITLIIGGILGALIAWALFTASTKENQAKAKFGSAKKAEEEIAEKAKQAKENRKAGSDARIESYLWNFLALVIFLVFGLILFNISG